MSPHRPIAYAPRPSSRSSPPCPRNSSPAARPAEMAVTIKPAIATDSQGWSIRAPRLPVVLRTMCPSVWSMSALMREPRREATAGAGALQRANGTLEGGRYDWMTYSVRFDYRPTAHDSVAVIDVQGKEPQRGRTK